MSSIPEEIYLEILLRVPAKFTSACKCVCKTWFELISDPDFVKMHLGLNTQTNKYRLMFGNDNLSVFRFISYDSLSSSSESDDLVSVELDFPYKSSKRIVLLGSCNGLLYGWACRLHFYFIWNPATTEYKKLPKLDKYTWLSKWHGLGYDDKTNDYKFVSIYENTMSIEVYSLTSNTWRSYQTQYEFCRSQSSAVFFSGAFHWFGWVTGKTFSVMIISMDISEEGVKELQLPETLPTTHMKHMNMGVLEGCLMVLVPLGMFNFQVWVMQEYGVLESWSRLHTIAFESTMCSTNYSVTLIGSFKKGEILFSYAGRNLIIYDTKSGTARKRNIPGSNMNTAVNYFESLVPLNSITAVGRRKKRESTRSLKKTSTKKTKM